MAKDRKKSAAAKRTWARIRAIAAEHKCSVQEARLILAAEKQGKPPPNPKELDVSATLPKPKTIKTVDVVAEEKKLRAKYAHVIAGTLKLPPPGERKRSVEIACQHKGCKVRRRVYTSDLFQVKFCKEHTRSRRKKPKQER